MSLSEHSLNTGVVRKVQSNIFLVFAFLWFFRMHFVNHAVFRLSYRLLSKHVEILADTNKFF